IVFGVVAQDDPLVLGTVDALHHIGIACFGPDKAAAAIEGSKVFSKDLMQKYGIPTAAYQAFDQAAAAIAYARQAVYPLVIKADGLALGKGVFICEETAQALEAIAVIMEEKKFGGSGNQIVIEECLSGPEVSVLAFTDSHTMIPMVSSMDHKRIGDNDTGLNTGGMGTVAPNPYYTPEIAAQCMTQIFLPTMKAMNAEGRPFKGCLYFGLMLTPDGPKVIEYNCRFGDPEAQVVLPLLQTDLLTVMEAVEEEKLADLEIKFSSAAACCVILASGGYPGSYQTGLPITIGNTGDAILYHAGTRLENGVLCTGGGRVLGVTALGNTLAEACEKAYTAAAAIDFPGKYYRRDIGNRAIAATKA
ncbi:MAG: phosphoribosylamine--glycine ligase, partial [Clostridiales bacterium]